LANGDLSHRSQTLFRRHLDKPLRPRVLVVTGLIIVVLFAIMVYYFKLILANMERQAVKTAQYEILAQLNFAAAGALTRLDGEALARLDGGNPLALSGAPSARESMLSQPKSPQDLPSGRWIFDPARGMLLYRFEHRSYQEEGSGVIGLRSRLRYVDRNGDGRFTYSVDLFQGVALDRVVLGSG